MTQALNGVVTAAAYPQTNQGGCQLGPVALGQQLDLTVGNAPALIRLFTLQNQGLGIGGGIEMTDEFVVVAGSGQISQASYRGCIGFMAKDFIAGTHATVYATVWEKGDPAPLGGSNYAGTLSSSGSGPGGNVTMQQIGSIDLTAVQTFSAISASYTHLLLKILARTAAVSAATPLLMALNFDGAVSYQWQELFANGAAAGGVESGGLVNVGRIGLIPGSVSPANAFGSCNVDLPFYNTTSFKRWLSEFGATSSVGAGGEFTGEISGVYESTSPVVAITLSNAAGAFAAGSSAYLYGIL